MTLHYLLFLTKLNEGVGSCGLFDFVAVLTPELAGHLLQVAEGSLLTCGLLTQSDVYHVLLYHVTCKGQCMKLYTRLGYIFWEGL